MTSAVTRKKIIHVVEDDEDISKLIVFNLTSAGFQVSMSSSGEDALTFLQENSVNLILLDLMLPGVNGIEICRTLRHKSSLHQLTPVIMITAKDTDEDIVEGLESGADDYVAKPFSPKVLLARINNALKNSRTEHSQTESDVIVRGEISIHSKIHAVKINNSEINLTRSEFLILSMLARKPGWVFSRSQIVDEIHGQGYAVTDRAIDFQMVGLRKKLADFGSLIETVRGIGYRFKGDEK